MQLKLDIKKNKMADSRVGYILDTDPWYDPDDTFALLMLLNSPEVKLDLIVTGDEISGKRAALEKWYLEQCGRGDIPIVAGCEHTGKTRIFCDDIIDCRKYRQPDNFIEAIRRVVEGNDRTIYICIQAFSNIAKFIQAYPELKNKIDLYQMGGVIDLKGCEVEHNIRIDIPSAQYVVKSGLCKKLVTLDTTLNKELEVSNESRLYERLVQSSKPEHRILARHCDLFHQALGCWTHMHDPLTTSVALGKDFVDFYEDRVEIDSNGKMNLSSCGNLVLLSKADSRAKEFMTFLENRLFLGERK